MAASGYTPISLYYSTTAAAAPVAGNLVNGELAINITDGKLYYKDNTGTVKVIAGTGGAGVVAGSNTQVQFNNNGVFGASSGLTWASSTLTASNITTAGDLTLSGGTANGVVYLNGSKVASAGSALTFDGTNLGIANINGATTLTLKTGGTAAVTVSATQKVGIGTATPLSTLHVVGGNSNNAIIDNGGQQYTTLSWYNNGVEKAQTYWDQTNGLFVSGTDVSAAYVFKTNGTEHMRIGGSTGNVSIGSASTPIKLLVNSTDAIGLPVGDTAQRPTGATGYIRFNTDIPGFEGYNGTSWLSVGGATISNDTTTASNLYPLFANATTGLATTIYTSNANYLYKPSTGELTAPELVAGNGIVVNSQTVNANYTIPVGYSASSAGPIAVAGGVVVTVSSGSRWVVQ